MLLIPNLRTASLRARIANAGAILSLCLFAILCSAAANADEVSLEARIQAIEAETQIRNLMVEYGQHLDKLDFVAYSQLFAKEGQWNGQTTGYVPVKGPENIRATMEKAFAERKYDPAHITNVHLVSNIRIEVDGDRATAYSKYTVMSRNEKDEPYVRLSGHYDDVYIREDGRWKILSRSALRDIPSP